MIRQARSNRIDSAVDYFDDHWSAAAHQQIQSILDRFDLSQDCEAATELIRVDIERRYDQGLESLLLSYFEEFGELLKHPHHVADIAFEDYRSREANGKTLDPTRWQCLPGIARQSWFQRLEPELGSGDGWERPGERPDGSIDARLAEDLSNIGFEAIRLIGEGAFSVVALARQTDLAQRFVVLKVVQQTLSEPENLASLQHTNIVPIYSFHRIPDRSVMCMPYSGELTLDAFLRSRTDVASRVGNGLITTVRTGSGSPSTKVESPLATEDQTDRDRSANRATSTRTSRLQSLAQKGDQPLGPLSEIRDLQCEPLALWIFGKLSAGLAHSHARGMLHGDLKPANVLIRHDGEPALLDFNLAQSTSDSKLKQIGGTLPYMPPEMLRALLGEQTRPQVQSDLYSLGVMLYEFVTGRMPYSPAESTSEGDIVNAIRERKRGAVPWRREDQVSDGLRRIIVRCLAVDPSDRYQTASELNEDLECQAKSQPLIHAAEPLSSRAVKSLRRSPAWYSAAAITLVLTGLLGFAVSGSIQAQKDSVQSQENERIAQHRRKQAEAKSLLRESAIAFAQFRDASEQMLTALTIDPARDDRSKVDQAFACLKDSGVLSRAGEAFLLETPGISENERENRRTVFYRHAGQMFYAEAKLLAARYEPGTAPSDELARLTDTLAIAKRFATNPRSRSMRFMEATEAKLLGDRQRGHNLLLSAEKIASTSSVEDFLDAIRLVGTPRALDAAKKLQSLDADGTIPLGAASTSIGFMQFGSHQYRRATLSFTRAIERAPHLSRLWYWRGMCYLRLYDGENAYSDFRNAVRREPTFAAAWAQLATASKWFGAWNRAIEDLTDGLHNNPQDPVLLMLRSQMYRHIGRQDEYRRDFEAAARATGLTHGQLIARGDARLRYDPAGAIQDLQKAETIIPNHPLPKERLAFAYYRRSDFEMAAAKLKEAHDIAPRDEDISIDLAVVLQRLGNTDEALDYAEIALQGRDSALTLYQAACVYAQSPSLENRKQAYPLLAKAITAGVGVYWIHSDKDLDPLRSSAEYGVLDQFSQWAIQASRKSDERQLLVVDTARPSLSYPPAELRLRTSLIPVR